MEKKINKKGGKLEKKKSNFGKKKEKRGKLEKKSEKKDEKKNALWCGWTVNSPHPLAYYLILNQLNIKKIKSTNIILKNKKIK